MVQLYGSEELKARHLKPMAAGGTFCATLGSERAAGIELGRIEPVVSEEGGELVVTGEKSPGGAQRTPREAHSGSGIHQRATCPSCPGTAGETEKVPASAGSAVAPLPRP
ncbi:hypothetical protein GCM10009601_30440 [Streptomyces thermospinosisporus]|uniref:Uncharacterized protein n=2 Tax=Streptomyces thermospinosisporus TaxID=161482 RepID=A0ABN1YXK5_9ACTN